MIINSVNRFNRATSINFFKKTFINLSVFLVTTILLITLNLWNFLLFHTVAEIFSSIVTLSIFIMAVNTYRVNKNNFLMFIGIGSLFVGIIDLLHSLAYPGIGVFPETSINMATQPPIVSGFIWSLTLLLSNIFIVNPNRKLPLVQVYMAFSIFFILSISSIFYFKVFPVSYIDGQGLTIFKKVSEYIIIIICIIAIALFYKNRRALDSKLFLYVALALFLMPVSRFSLTLFFAIEDLSNVISHLVRVICFMCIYKGIVEVGLQRPFDMLSSKMNEVDTSLKNEYLKRKRMEATLINNEKCYELLIENNRDAIFVHSEGRVVFVNQGAVKLSKVSSPEDLVGMLLEDIIPDQCKGNVLNVITTLNNNIGKISPVELSLPTLNGQTLEIEVESAKFVYRGKPAILNIVRDISSRKKIAILEKDIEHTREFSQAQSEFFGNISHELKTPLNVLLGAIQVLTLPSAEDLPKNFEKKLNKYLWTMKQNCYRLLRLVNNLIDLSKVDSGFLKLNLRNCNIVSIVEDITLSVSDYIENKGVELIFDTDIEEKIMAFDADKIERIMLNLLSNSIKFTNPGDSILVNITDMNERIKISVKDTGVGIPEDKLELIFDRFAQVDKTLSRNHEGSGIGLALVKSLIALHEGTITVSSTLQKGSEFTVELPAKLLDVEEAIENIPFQSSIERINIEFSDIYSSK